MSVSPTRRQIIRWHLSRHGVFGYFRLALWLCSQPRYYGRVLSLAWGMLRRQRSDGSEQQDDTNSNIRCETDRLALRPVQLSDLDALAELLPPGSTWRDEVGLTSELLEGWMTLAAFHKDGGGCVGMFALRKLEVERQQEYELGYRTRHDQFGNGFATEGAMAMQQASFGQLGIARLISLIDPDNIASIRVAEKNGMRFVGNWSFNGHLVRIYTISRSDPESSPNDAAAS